MSEINGIEEHDYRKGMKYNKAISTNVYHHSCDESKLPEGCVVLGRDTRILKLPSILLRKVQRRLSRFAKMIPSELAIN